MRRNEAAERFADRRRQEDEAPRLRDVVPDLVSCRIEIAESRGARTTADVTHTRHLVVEHAPALVVIPCSEPSCRGGGHDITSALLQRLREAQSEIRGEDPCYGQSGAADCGRVMRYRAVATYKSST